MTLNRIHDYLNRLNLLTCPRVSAESDKSDSAIVWDMGKMPLDKKIHHIYLSRGLHLVDFAEDCETMCLVKMNTMMLVFWRYLKYVNAEHLFLRNRAI